MADDAVWSVQDAKNRFSEVVDAARDAPQTVTKHGKRAVVIWDAEKFDQLKKQAASKRQTLNELLLSIPQGDEDIFKSMPFRKRKNIEL